MRILSTGTSKEVKFNFFFDGVSRPLLLVLMSEDLSLRSLFLLYNSTFSSFFHLPTNPFAVRASSPFIYFWALNSRSVIEVGGVFPNEKTRLVLFNSAWKVVIITRSFALSISNTALLKRFTYSLKVSLSCCFTVSRYKGCLLWRCLPMKCQTKELLNCSKLAINNASSLLNHTLATPLRVVGKDLQITSSGVCWRFNIALNAPMWSRVSIIIGL